MSLRRLNIGCGQDIRVGYINADMYPGDERVQQANILELPFPDNSFDEVLALDIVEHVSWRKVPQALSQIARVLKPTGKAEIRVPELDALLELRRAGRMTDTEYVRRIFGDQGHPGDFHAAGFTQKTFLDSLSKAGLKVHKTWAKNGNRIALVSPK